MILCYKLIDFSVKDFDGLSATVSAYAPVSANTGKAIPRDVITIVVLTTNF